MSSVAASLSTKVHRGVATVTVRCGGWVTIPGPEALETGRRLDQRSVHGEVLVREQAVSVCCHNDFIEQCLTHMVLQKALTVLGEGGGIETGLDQVHVQEPAEEQMIVQFLTEGPLTADRVEGDQYRGLQEPLGRNRRPASLCVHPVKLRRERRQGLVRQGLDRPQRMLWRHSALQVDEAKHGHLRVSASAHWGHLPHRFLKSTPLPPLRRPSLRLFQQPARASARGPLRRP